MPPFPSGAPSVAPASLPYVDRGDAAAFLRELLDETTELVCAADAEGRVTYVNRAWMDTLGYSTDDAVGRRAFDFVSVDDRARWLEAARRLHAGEPILDFEAVLLAADGRRIACRGRATPQMVDDPFAPNGRRCVGTRAYYRDVTAERRAEAERARRIAKLEASPDFKRLATEDALRRSQGQLRAVLDHAAIGVSIVSPTGVLLVANAALHRFLGYEDGELVGRFAPSLSPAEDAPTSREAVATLRAGRAPSVTVAKRFFRRDGEVRWGELTLTLVPLADGETGVLGMIIDRTERWRAERERRLLLEVTRAIAEAPDADAAIATTLEAMCAATGWEYAEAWHVEAGAAGVPELRHGQVWHVPNDELLERFAQASRAVTFRKGHGVAGTAWARRAPMQFADLPGAKAASPRRALLEETRLVTAVAVPVVADDEVLAVLMFHTRDAARIDAAGVDLVSAVAAQIGGLLRTKQAKTALLRERSFLGALLDSLTDGIVACDEHGTVTLCNPALRAMYGVDAMPTSPEGRRALRATMRSDDGTRVLDDAELPLVRAARGETVQDVALVVAPPDRPRRHVVASARPIVDGDGARLGAVAVYRDVTAQRRTETALRDNAARLSLIYNSATDLMFLVAVERDAGGAPATYRCESVNDAYLQITGLAAEEVLGRTVHEILPPEAAAHALEKYAEAVRTGDVQRYDEDVELPTRRLIVETTLTPVHDDDGVVTHLLGTARDVTARRLAEAERERLVTALRESEARYRALVDLSPDAVVVHAAGRLQYVNDAAVRLFGAPDAAALVDRPMLDLVHPDDRAAVAERVRRARATGEPAPLAQERLVRVDTGETIYAEIAGAPVRFALADGALDAMQVVVRDVTARHVADAEVRAAREHLAQLVEAQHAVATSVLDLDTMLTVVVERSLELTPADAAVVELVDEDRLTLTHRAGAGGAAANVGVRLGVDGSLSGLAVRTDAVFRCDDTETDPRVDRETCRRVGARSLVGVPLRHAGEVVGVLKVSSPKPRAFGAQDVATLEMLGGLAAAGIREAAALDAKQQLVAERTRALDVLRESEARVRGALEASLDALLVFRAVDAREGPGFAVVDCNRQATLLVGASRDALVGRALDAIFPGARRRGLVAACQKVAATGEPHVTEYRMDTGAAPVQWARLQLVRVGDDVAITARDITQEKESEDALRTLALVDELTGVYNRRGFMHAAEREWSRAMRERHGALLVYIDLDDFKSINDTFGHPEGDIALRAASDVLRAAFRGADVIGRLGGDEFAVLVVPTGGTTAQSAKDPSAEIDVTERAIRERLQHHLDSANAAAQAVGRPYEVSLSIGIARYAPEVAAEGPTAPVSLTTLMIEADERLYEQKRARRAGPRRA